MRDATSSIGGKASVSIDWTIEYSATILGTNASQGECSPMEPARELFSTIIVYALSNQRLRALSDERML